MRKTAVEANGLQKPTWMLVVATVLAVGSGGAYFWNFFHGLRGEELLEFTTIFVAVPLGLSLILLFKYLKS